MAEYFSPPELCSYYTSGILPFTCEHLAKTSCRNRFVCLYKKQWHAVHYKFKCPNKEFQDERAVFVAKKDD